MACYISIQVVTSIIKLVKIDKPSCIRSVKIVDVLDTTNMPFGIHVTYTLNNLDIIHMPFGIHVS